MFAGKNNWDPNDNNGADFAAPPVPQLLVVGATDNDGLFWTGVREKLKRHNLDLLTFEQSARAAFVAMTAPGVNAWIAFPNINPVRLSGTSIGDFIIDRVQLCVDITY